MTTMPDGSITLSERLQLNKLYRKGPSAYGSIKSLCKSSGLTRKKVETFLESKSAYTKFKQRRENLFDFLLELDLSMIFGAWI